MEETCWAKDYFRNPILVPEYFFCLINVSIGDSTQRTHCICKFTSSLTDRRYKKKYISIDHFWVFMYIALTKYSASLTFLEFGHFGASTDKIISNGTQTILQVTRVSIGTLPCKENLWDECIVDYVKSLSTKCASFDNEIRNDTLFCHIFRKWSYYMLFFKFFSTFSSLNSFLLADRELLMCIIQFKTQLKYVIGNSV